MDELSEKISQMLNDPASMEQIRSMASSLFSGDEPAQGGGNVQGGDDGILDPAMLMKVAGILKRNVDDDRAKLLFALRPHLSAERQKRVDKAVKILKLVSLIPIFKEQGILDF